jgi:hypothetical protein
MTCNAVGSGNQAYVDVYESSGGPSRMICLIGGLLYPNPGAQTVGIDAAVAIPIPAGGYFEFWENTSSNSGTISWEYLKVHSIVGGSSVVIYPPQSSQ